MDDKVYSNEVIQENPFPNGEVQVDSQSSSGSGDLVTNTVIKENKIPRKRISNELLSTALNTRSRNILQEFNLTQSGGFKIGNYQEGVSGEISITPNGIVTKDKAGVTTIAIYGEDGSGVFKGSIQAGSIITGEVIVGDNALILDGLNRSIIVNDGSNDRILIGNLSF